MVERGQDSRGVLRALIRWLVRRYYPRLEITAADTIPQTGAVLLCANHSNSLIDPVFVGIAARRPVRFLAKATLFDWPLVGRLLHALGMVPVFRGSDDQSQVRKNFASLDTGAALLGEGLAIGIFPEGRSTDSANLQSLRSGAARMALTALEVGADTVTLVPIGINYESKERTRTAAWIRVGEPIDVAEWLQQHDGDERVARRALTTELEKRLREIVVHLDEPEWEPWLTDLEILLPGEDARQRNGQLVQRKRIADAINHFLATDRPRAESVAAQITEYRDEVAAAGLSLDSAVLAHRGPVSLLIFTLRLLWLVIGFVPATLTAIHHMVPFVVTRGLASRFGPKDKTTVSSVRFSAGLPIYLTWYVLVAVWMFDYFAPWFVWTWLFVMPIAGVCALAFWRGAQVTALRLWHQILVVVRRSRLVKLRSMQRALREQLRGLAAEFATVSPRPAVEERPARWRIPLLVTAQIAATAVLVLAAWLLFLWMTDRPMIRGGEDLAAMTSTELDRSLADSERALIGLLDGFDDLEADAMLIRADFRADRRNFTNQADSDAIRELLRRYMTLRTGLFGMLGGYQRHAEVEDERQRLRAFLLNYTAGMVVYEASLKFVHQFGETPASIDKLNEAEPLWGIPAGFYDRVRRNLASPANAGMLSAGRRYYKSLAEQFRTHGLVEAHHRPLHTAIREAEAVIDKIEQPEFLVQAIDDVRDVLDRLRYQTQSMISTWIGDAMIRHPRAGQSLISKEHLERLASMLQPGDVLLERRNWYLSNAFLPGFWPHGAVYVGDAKDLESRGLRTHDDVKIHWTEFTSLDATGHQRVIVEAISEGVVFSSLDHSIGGADAVAVLRPRLPETEIRRAIATAFRFAKRPYDFEFDFASTDKLVCTEVIYRAYGGNSGTMQFPLERIMGRTTMPAINLVRKFRDERGKADAQFDFIAMIDGDEATGTSTFVTDPEVFISTLDRPALTWLQGDSLRLPLVLASSIGPLGRVLLYLTALCLLLRVVPRIWRRIDPTNRA